MSFTIIIFYLLVLDSVCCNIMVFFDDKWYTKHFRTLSRLIPPAKGWSVYYLVLVFWIGLLTYHAV